MSVAPAASPLNSESHQDGVAPLVVRSHRSIAEIGRDRWQRLTGASQPPHLSFEWLDALERSGAVAPERGWLPLHLTVERDEQLIAAAPAYLRGDSSGEFVFDQSWAAFAERELGQRYYPKLVVAVPFTPATGPRVLLAPGQDAAFGVGAVERGLRALTERLELSGAHVLFPEQGQVALLGAAGWQLRHAIQFHWFNAGYRTFEEFLGGFTAKRRHQIRRERRLVAEQGIVVEALTGSSLTPELSSLAHRLYRSTVDKFFYGRRYLNERFFELVFESMPERILLIVARDRAGRIVAGAFNLLGDDALYGRYWGTLEEVPFLHFECCYYRGVEEAIDRGLSRFEPGAGGEHKLARGFSPTCLRSAHHLRSPLLARAVEPFLAQERRAIDAELEAAGLHTGRRSAGVATGS